MLSQYRNTKVFAATLISIIAGAIVLKTLGNNPPSAGAFSLSDYYRLEPVEEAVSSQVVQLPWRWNYIEIYYSGPEACNINQPISPGAATSPEDIGCHFVVCNGLGGSDGQIQSTEKWQRQLPITSERTSSGSEQAVRICVIAGAKIIRPTDFQIKRTEALVEDLSRKFSIGSASICYPDSWRRDNFR